MRRYEITQAQAPTSVLFWAIGFLDRMMSSSDVLHSGETCSHVIIMRTIVYY